MKYINRLSFQKILISLTGLTSVLYFFRRLLFNNEYLIGVETWLEGIGSNKYNFNLLKKGILPIWSPEMDLGYPIFEDPILTYWLHPINFLFFFFPAHLAHNLSIILYFI